MFQKVQYGVTDGVATIEMVYPKNLNAIDEQMAEELLEALALAERDEAVRVIVLKGGEKAFSAGGDIGYFYDLVKSGEAINMDGLIEKVGKLALACKQSSKLIIAAVQGAAAGAGASLAFSADFIFCTEQAKFILAFVQLGLAPDTGVTYLLAKQIGDKRAMELAVTGRPLGATEAKELGLVYTVTSKEELDGVVNAFANKLVAGPAVAYANIKKQVVAVSFLEYEAFLKEVESKTQSICSNTEDFKEGVAAFMEKRKPDFQGK